MPDMIRWTWLAGPPVDIRARCDDAYRDALRRWGVPEAAVRAAVAGRFDIAGMIMAEDQRHHA